MESNVLNEIYDTYKKTIELDEDTAAYQQRRSYMEFKTSCLCHDIENYNDYKRRKEELDWNRRTCIVYDDIHNSYGLWIECEDSYYSGWEMTIKYCPKCGRKL